MSRAVVLLSGGLDSATVLAIAKERGLECYAISFDYGQRHVEELVAARAVTRILGAVDHRVVRVGLARIGGSALTDGSISVPKAGVGDDIPITYVPARNSVFLSLAFSWAEVLGAERVFAGMNVLDYSGYPDCRPEFVAAFQEALRLGTRPRAVPIEICTPLIKMTKAEIVQEGVRLGVPFAVTMSCYDPVGHLACRYCDACRLRAKGFCEAGITDPTRYVS